MRNVILTNLKYTKMKRPYAIAIMLGLILLGCTNSKKNIKINEKIEFATNLTENDGLKLLQQKCYACHSVNSTSHDAIIAPPMVAVVRRYKMLYQNKDAFVEGVTNWVLNPTEEKALMRGAVSQFNVMPKQPFDKGEIITISQYMYDNDMESPIWFENHFNKEHRSGMSNGFGKGRGRQ